MSSQYYYQSGGQELGPVSFHALVRLVQDEKLFANDLVKAEWESEWHPSATVIGLFHMAKRTDLPLTWQELDRQRRSSEVQSDKILNGSEFDIDSLTELFNAQMSLNRVEAAQEPTESSQRAELPVKAQPMQSARSPSLKISNCDSSRDQTTEDRRSLYAGVMEEAVQHVELKRSFRSAHFAGALNTLLKLSLRLFSTGSAAALSVWSLCRWNQVELLRFPDHNILAHGARILPLLGVCSHVEFFIILFNVAVISGLIGYALSFSLERIVD